MMTAIIPEHSKLPWELKADHPFRIQSAEGVTIAIICQDILKAAVHAMKAYQYGNSYPTLANEMEQAVNTSAGKIESMKESQTATQVTTLEDINGSRLTIEKRPEDVRISIGTRDGLETFFYATSDQMPELINAFCAYYDASPETDE